MLKLYRFHPRNPDLIPVCNLKTMHLGLSVDVAEITKQVALDLEVNDEDVQLHVMYMPYNKPPENTIATFAAIGDKIIDVPWGYVVIFE